MPYLVDCPFLNFGSGSDASPRAICRSGVQSCDGGALRPEKYSPRDSDLGGRTGFIDGSGPPACRFQGRSAGPARVVSTNTGAKGVSGLCRTFNPDLLVLDRSIWRTGFHIPEEPWEREVPAGNAAGLYCTDEITRLESLAFFCFVRALGSNPAGGKPTIPMLSGRLIATL
jgi:hypothetical protein